MKIKFKEQEFQKQAIQSVINLFNGQNKQDYTTTYNNNDIQTTFLSNDINLNYINIPNEKIVENMKRVQKQNNEIVTNINNIEQDLTKCIQKVGIVRYNAFKDTGSDLSFALALLDENNDGVVLNGIY